VNLLSEILVRLMPDSVLKMQIWRGGSETRDLVGKVCVKSQKQNSLSVIIYCWWSTFGENLTRDLGD
jgi:hypothetical protein